MHMLASCSQLTGRLRAVLICCAMAACAVIAAPADALGAVSIGTSARVVKFGKSVRLSGERTPVAGGGAVVVERRYGRSAAWKRIRTTAPAAGTGAWSITIKPGRRAYYRARSVADGTVSRSIEVWVRARLSIRRVGAKPFPFGGARVEVTVRPAQYRGKVRVTVRGPAGVAGKAKRPRNGRLKVTVPVDGVGKFRITASAPVMARYAKPAPVTVPVTVRGRTFREGAKGPDVAALMRRLGELGFHLPGDGGRYTFRASEVALAFKKAYGLPRNYGWGSREWKKITGLRHGPRVKTTTGKAVHLEVDKSRQLLFVARGAKVLGILHVSTGRTGNTPIGKFRIYQRGGSYLYRFMAFHGEYGLHGYPSVPPYPASAGCVREPMWAATWVWNQTKYGTLVHVYA